MSGSSYINTGTSNTSSNPAFGAPWQTLCSGLTGAQGIQGVVGPAGSLSNHFSGEFAGLSYSSNTVVTYLGSSFINTGVSATSNTPPAVPWQLLAKSGLKGDTGPAGVPSALVTHSFNLRFGYDPSNSDSLILNPASYQLFSVNISDDMHSSYDNPALACVLTVSGDNFPIGTSLIIKVKNIDIPYNPAGSTPLIDFAPIPVLGTDYNIKWPNNQYSMPLQGKSHIYTILRFADEGGIPTFCGTYSNPYTN